jgi:hypothetical protein
LLLIVEAIPHTSWRWSSEYICGKVSFRNNQVLSLSQVNRLFRRVCLPTLYRRVTLCEAWSDDNLLSRTPMHNNPKLAALVRRVRCVLWSDILAQHTSNTGLLISSALNSLAIFTLTGAATVTSHQVLCPISQTWSASIFRPASDSTWRYFVTSTLIQACAWLDFQPRTPSSYHTYWNCHLVHFPALVSRPNNSQRMAYHSGHVSLRLDSVWTL